MLFRRSAGQHLIMIDKFSTNHRSVHTYPLRAYSNLTDAQKIMTEMVNWVVENEGGSEGIKEIRKIVEKPNEIVLVSIDEFDVVRIDVWRIESLN